MSRTRLIGRNLPAESRPGKGQEGERDRTDRVMRGGEREKTFYSNTISNIENTYIKNAATGI